MNTWPHFTKPDADNLEKYLNDCFKGVVWSDDAQISWLLRSKTHTDHREGGTIFYAIELPEKGKPDYEKLLAVIRENIEVNHF
jgi:hypothetical protein